ncbi:hypothetical protein R6Q57_026598 [Mikania cordata]
MRKVAALLRRPASLGTFDTGNNTIMAGEFDEVLRVYLSFRQRKIGLHGSAFTFSLKSCVQLCRKKLGKSIHVDILKFGLNTDRFVGSSLIGFYSMFKAMVDACKVFDEITERDIVAYTAIHL